MTTTTTRMMVTKIVVLLTVVNLLVFSSAIEDKHEVSFTFGYYKRPLFILPATSNSVVVLLYIPSLTSCHTKPLLSCLSNSFALKKSEL